MQDINKYRFINFRSTQTVMRFRCFCPLIQLMQIVTINGYRKILSGYRKILSVPVLKPTHFLKKKMFCFT